MRQNKWRRLFKYALCCRAPASFLILSVYLYALAFSFFFHHDTPHLRHRQREKWPFSHVHYIQLEKLQLCKVHTVACWRYCTYECVMFSVLFVCFLIELESIGLHIIWSQDTNNSFMSCHHCRFCGFYLYLLSHIKEVSHWTSGQMQSKQPDLPISTAGLLRLAADSRQGRLTCWEEYWHHSIHSKKQTKSMGPHDEHVQASYGGDSASSAALRNKLRGHM